MNNFIVYSVIFTDRMKNNIQPYCYIGSKTNAIVKNGMLYNSRNKPYWGSTEDKIYQELIKNGEPKQLNILFKCSDYTTMIQKEREIHLKLDVVADTKYFNKSIAMDNNYSNPDFATYRNVMTGKIARLQRNHEKVLNGEWVGITRNSCLSDGHKKKIKDWIVENGNPFKGKKHTSQTRKDMREKALQRWVDNEEMRKDVGERAKKAFTGKPKTEEQKSKMSKSGMGFVTLKNKDTNECVRIKRDSPEFLSLDKQVWLNPFKLAMLRRKQNENN